MAQEGQRPDSVVFLLLLHVHKLYVTEAMAVTLPLHFKKKLYVTEAMAVTLPLHFPINCVTVSSRLQHESYSEFDSHLIQGIYFPF